MTSFFNILRESDISDFIFEIKGISKEKAGQTVTDKVGRTLIKNKKTGSVYFVKNINNEKHQIVKRGDVHKKDIKSAEDISNVKISRKDKILRSEISSKIENIIQK